MGKYSDAWLDLQREPAKEQLWKERDPRGYEHLRSEAHRELGRENFWYFATEILKNPVLYEPLHRPLCDWWQDRRRTNKMVIIPRGHVKSMLFTVAYAVWRVVQNQNVRILIVSHKLDDTKRFIHAVRDYLESDLVTDVYPWIRPAGQDNKKVKWSDNAIRVVRDMHLKEHTVEGTSTSANVTGRHFDEILFDDMVTFESVETPEAIEKTKNFHIHSDALLDPGGFKSIAGTRYDYMDEYGRIMDTPSLAAEWDCVVLPAVRHKGAALLRDHPVAEKIWRSTVEGQPIFPTRFTVAEEDEPGKISLPKIKRTTSSFFYASQYENDPVDPETALFKREEIRVVKNLPTDKGELKFFRVCDLSGEGNTESFTAIVTGAVDGFANIYITDVFWGQYNSAQIVEELIEGQRRPGWVPADLVGFEPAPFERLLKVTLDQRMVEEKVIVPYQFLDGVQAQKAKNDRIKGIKWWFESGKFHVLEGCRHADLLVDEFIKFPRYKRKDIADATAQIPHIMWPGDKPKDLNGGAKPRRTMDDEIKELIAQGNRTWLGNDHVMESPVAVLAGW